MPAGFGSNLANMRGLESDLTEQALHFLDGHEQENKLSAQDLPEYLLLPSDPEPTLAYLILARLPAAVRLAAQRSSERH